MELKVQEYVLPEAILFNFEELKAQIAEKTEQYTKLVYTEDNIKAAKEDRADLNRLKKALNDERLRRQKEYLKPFDAFKAQIDEIITIIDKPVLAIDRQIKEFEAIKQDEKRMNIEDLFKNMLFPEFVKIEQIWNPKWLNATFSMNQIEQELLAHKNRITSECQTLAALPSYSHEAVLFYKKTLSIEQALAKVRELTEIDKAREEAKKHEEELKALNEQAKAAAEIINRVEEKTEDPTPVIEVSRVEPEPEEPKMWVAFEALLTKSTAAALKQFFDDNNIEFKPVNIKNKEEK